MPALRGWNTAFASGASKRSVRTREAIAVDADGVRGLSSGDMAAKSHRIAVASSDDVKRYLLFLDQLLLVVPNHPPQAPDRLDMPF